MHLETAIAPSISSMVHTLQLTHTLTHLRVEGYFQPDDIVNGTALVTLPSLTHLRSPQSLLRCITLTDALTFLEILFDGTVSLSVVSDLERLPSSLKQLTYPDAMIAKDGGNAWRIISTKFRDLETLSIRLCHGLGGTEYLFTAEFLEVSTDSFRRKDRYKPAHCIGMVEALCVDHQ
jgi:hypothetical protein